MNKHVIDPTVHRPEELSKKYRFKVFIEKCIRIVWFIVIAFIIFEIILIAVKSLNKPPHERTCWDASMCFNYCEFAKQKRCLLPENKESLSAGQSWLLLITGKRTIIELLDDSQKYCACEIQNGDKTRTETFYKFYLENK